MVDDRSVGPGRSGQILGGVLASQVQARVGHQAAQHAGQEVQVSGLRGVEPLVQRLVDPAESLVHGGEQGERRAGDVGAAEADDFGGELLQGSGADAGDRRVRGVVAGLGGGRGQQVWLGDAGSR